MKPWEGIIRVPEGRSGKVSVQHFKRPAGPVERSSLRGRALSGQSATPVMFHRETRWHRLLVDDWGVWMTDQPIEQQQHDDLLRDFRGDVLVGGLGLGYAATVLARRRAIRSVTVVEIDPDVVALVEPHLLVGNLAARSKVKVVTEDLRAWLRACKEAGTRHDWAFYDTWQCDGMAELLDDVTPLRQLSDGVVHDGYVRCWNEDVMRGQLFFALVSKHAASKIDPVKFPLECWADFRSPASIWHDWSVPFFRSLRAGEFPVEQLDTAAHCYARLWGRPDWQTAWRIALVSNLIGVLP